ncbi:hypothetical protein ACKKE3_005377, partial [Escherichia coli]
IWGMWKGERESWCDGDMTPLLSWWRNRQIPVLPGDRDRQPEYGLPEGDKNRTLCAGAFG